MDGPEALGEVVSPRVVKKRIPTFPQGAEASGLEDTTIVEVKVDRTGKVSGPQILKRPEAPAFAYVALEAMRRWLFAPGALRGNPIDTRYRVTFVYKFRR